jgi:hypothetical protein
MKEIKEEEVPDTRYQRVEELRSFAVALDHLKNLNR